MKWYYTSVPMRVCINSVLHSNRSVHSTETRKSCLLVVPSDRNGLVISGVLLSSKPHLKSQVSGGHEDLDLKLAEIIRVSDRAT